jgi:hypothetical protein
MAAEVSAENFEQNGVIQWWMFLMQWSDTVAVRAVFLSRIHENRWKWLSLHLLLGGNMGQPELQQKKVLKADDCSGSLRVCHAGSVATGFIPEREVFWRSKLRTYNHHNEVTAEAFKKVVCRTESSIHFLWACFHNGQCQISTQLCQTRLCTHTRKDAIIGSIYCRNILHTASHIRAYLSQSVKMYKLQYKVMN